MQHMARSQLSSWPSMRSSRWYQASTATATARSVTATVPAAATLAALAAAGPAPAAAGDPVQPASGAMRPRISAASMGR